MEIKDKKMKNEEYMNFKISIMDESGPMKIIPELLTGLLYQYFEKIGYPIISIKVEESL